MKDHTLMQAFSRTNRIFNNKKEFGNIVSFFSLKDNLDEALKLFGDDGGTIAILRSFNDYYLGYKDKDNNTKLGYKTYVEDLRNKFPINKNELLMSIEDKKEFINLFSKFLKSRNLLNSFTNDFTDDKKIIVGNELDKYIGWYNQFGNELKQSINNEKVDVSDSLNFNSELVSEYDINIAYI
ncbi:type I restriction endonuclease subunit R [bacterium]|nr:type I restriction endonuclease subunit R [bacterium]